MNKINNVLSLVGSPKGSRSTSDSLSSYLISSLEQLGVKVEKEFIYNLVNKEEGQKKLLDSVEEADVIVLAFPLYVDCLPAGVIKTLELIADLRKSKKEWKKQGFAVIVNCGFAEAHHNNTAVAICENFAEETGFDWKGALSLGMGGFFNGRSLEECGSIVKKLKKGLDLAARALAKGELISDEIIDLVGKKFMPISIYKKVASISFKKQAKNNGVKKRIKDQPYL
ncbi:MAG: NAD(P)H-dependent oxidoreductase [Candidatus Lokiarchaeota archaeon]|nr:NAD(P)H-dependent oxidoreductase [Candidatus Lokiarchaeota archaeon]